MDIFLGKASKEDQVIRQSAQQMDSKKPQVDIPIKIPSSISVIFYEKQYNQTRRNIIIKLLYIFHKIPLFNNLTKDNQTNLLKIIESYQYNKAIAKAKLLGTRCAWDDPQFEKLYGAGVMKILFDLDPDSLVGGNLAAIVSESYSKDLKRSAVIRIVEDYTGEGATSLKKKIEERRAQKIEHRFSTLYACRNCKKYTCITNLVQTRGSDEGSTPRVECVSCKMHFFA